MTGLSGKVVVHITKNDGSEDYEDVLGVDFRLEEGGDWEPDEEGELKAGFILIAFRDEYEVKLSASIHGRVITHHELTITKTEDCPDDIKGVRIYSDDLELLGLIPPATE